jgi:hypothetical protein
MDGNSLYSWAEVGNLPEVRETKIQIEIVGLAVQGASHGQKLV